MKADSSFAKVVGRTINALFQRMGELDFECRDRLCAWFGFHLSNVGLKFPWSRWADAVERGNLNPKRQFLRTVFEDVVLFHYLDHVRAEMEANGPELLPLLPPPELSAFSYTAEHNPNLETIANSVLEMISSKTPAAEVLTRFDELNITSQFSEETEVDLFVQCVLQAAKEALSHAIKLIFLYKDVFVKRIATSSHRKEAIIKAICQFWKSSEYHQVFLIDRIVRFGIIDSSIVLNWLFEANQAEIPPLLCSSRYFSLIDMMIQLNELKVSKSIELLEAASKNQPSAPISSTTPPMNGEDSESALKDQGEEQKQAPAQTTEAAEAKLEEASRSEKDFFLLLFQRFVMLIGNLHQQNPTGWNGESTEDDSALKIAVGRMIQIARSHWSKISQFVDSLDSLVFFGELGPAKQAFDSVKVSQLQ
jgi:nuclear cap-binding protein subunit 1